jgi:hypothetical protein
VIRDRGVALGELLGEIEQAARALPGEANAMATTPPGNAPSSLFYLRSGLLEGCGKLRVTTADLTANAAHEPDLIGATAHHFLQWLGVLVGGWQLALTATRAAAESDKAKSDKGVARETTDIAAFYGAHILPRYYAHEATIKNGVRVVAQASIADL